MDLTEKSLEEMVEEVHKKVRDQNIKIKMTPTYMTINATARHYLQRIQMMINHHQDWAAAERPWPGLKTDQPSRAMMIILSRGKSDA